MSSQMMPKSSFQVVLFTLSLLCMTQGSTGQQEQEWRNGVMQTLQEMQERFAQLGVYQREHGEAIQQFQDFRRSAEEKLQELEDNQTNAQQQVQELAENQNITDQLLQELLEYRRNAEGKIQQMSNAVEAISCQTSSSLGCIDGSCFECKPSCTLFNGTCQCTSPNRKDCSDILSLGGTENGVYTVYAGPNQEPVEVYCDQKTDGGGWLVFQRRQDGLENFYRNWTDYENGFGDLDREFWLGNHFINLISEQDDYTLRVDLEDFTGATAYAQYSHFSVGTASLKYRMTLGDYDDDSTAGNSLTRGNGGMKFSTYDQDNDVYNGNCASMYKGAWWYSYCAYSNLNGQYLGGPNTATYKGVNWYHWKGWTYSLKTTEMKIRPFGMRGIRD